ncbi:siderophore transport protein [Gracilibacillus boraciitolerans JCM 21714]|uniref:Siderophore transport protein n=1 Tax=Gracilibacillus boraciitolerans JCM 21714 TaxID=1298598 RepID=W4VQH9_9BACI|nr:MFS transporter [Gracilibacillus boraciitolerans]GAE95138.1 siderophore transport protein [Gracilibacillus boraciitolerans JCM 21714]
MKEKKLDLIALASIPLVMTLGNSMLIPILPIIEKKIDITPFQSSLIITVYSIVAILLIPFAGYLSDKIGRKKVIIPSLIITGIGGLISAFAAWKLENPFMLILVGRFLQGIGASGAFPVVLPTVGDMFKDEKVVSAGLGLIETSNTFGKVLSPVIGAWLAIFLWFLPFVFIPIFSAIAVVLVLFMVKSPKDQEKKQQTFKEFLQFIKKVFHDNGRWLITTFVIGCINMFVLFGFLFHFSTLLEKQYDKEGIIKGLILAIPLLFLCIASYAAGKKIGENKVIMKWVILAGNVIASVPLLFVKPDVSLTYLVVMLSIAGVGIGISLPALDALITEGIKKDVRGTVTSLYSSMRFLGVAAGPPVIAILMKNNEEWMYYILAGMGGVAVLITLFAIKPKANEAS